jgi:DNA gyrase subunit B
MTDRTATIPQSYTEENIKKLNPMEHIRLRPGMYVGGKDARALHHLIYEVVDNAIDEALAGRCDTIMVTLYDNNIVAIDDNGVGIPVGWNKQENMSTLELVLTQIGAGGKFDNGAYKVSGGLHGVGVSAVNALSSELIAEVRRDGHLWRQTYSEGKSTSELQKVRKLEPGEPTGTRIQFQPDFTVMEENDFSYTTLATRFREMAFVTRRVTISLRDERVKPIPRETTFYFEGGLRSFVRYINRNREALHTAIHAEREVEITPDGKQNQQPFTIGVEVAFQYNDTANVTEMAFANTINNPDGGTHLTGLRSAVTGVINRYARKSGLLKEKDNNFSGTDTLEGITAIVSVKHPHPSFESQTKVKLINPEAMGAVSQVVNEIFNEFLELNPRDARRIIEKCMTSMRAREAARKARDLVRSGPSLLESTTLPGKLADCSKHGESAEIYIVEGDSAGGSAKQGRDRHFQAILPLRGKILNTERARLDKMLDNNEIKALISALGTGISEDFRTEGLRYGRVIIMTDADVDGAHIASLLITFFYRQMPKLIDNGHLFLAVPPLFRITAGAKTVYARDEAERARIIAREFKGKKVEIGRFKGLGEMMPAQLKETTMDPRKRLMLRVAVAAEERADTNDAIERLMGNKPESRFIFIQERAAFAQDLDI